MIKQWQDAIAIIGIIMLFVSLKVILKLRKINKTTFLIKEEDKEFPL